MKNIYGKEIPAHYPKCEHYRIYGYCDGELSTASVCAECMESAKMVLVEFAMEYEKKESEGYCEYWHRIGAPFWDAWYNAAHAVRRAQLKNTNAELSELS